MKCLTFVTGMSPQQQHRKKQTTSIIFKKTLKREISVFQDMLLMAFLLRLTLVFTNTTSLNLLK